MSFFRQIHVFRTVMTSASLTEAARKLFLTQPAVTKQIKALELHLGVELFNREGHRLQPNSRAQALFKSSLGAFEAMQALERDALKLREEGQNPIRIVAMPMVARLWLPRHIGRLFAQAPDTEFKIRVARSERISELLLNNQADIGIGMLNRLNVELNMEVLFSSNAVVILPEGHALASRPSISPGDICDEDFLLAGDGSPLRQDILSAFSNAGVSPKLKAEIELEETTIALVDAALGVAIVDSYSAQQRKADGARIAIVPFRPTLTAYIGLMLNRGVAGRPGVSAVFREMVKVARA
ncbi:MAG: LysR family transcriptional regulator [Pseudomonadota bacterium]